MSACPSCHHFTAVRHGHDRAGRQRFRCNGCRRTFTTDSVTAFAGYRWPAEVILMAVRWYLAHPLSGTSVMTLLAERDIDVSPRTVLRWVQTFGPRLAAELRKHRRRRGTTWYVDEVFFFRKKGEEKRYLDRAIDEHGQVLDVLFRDHRDTESAKAFFRRTLGSAVLACESRLSRYCWRNSVPCPHCRCWRRLDRLAPAMTVEPLRRVPTRFQVSPAVSIEVVLPHFVG